MGMNNFLTDNCQLVTKDNLEYYIIPRMDEVQHEMLRLLSIVDKACQSLNITYWLDAGTLIGAIRHQGFIPWDDDIDIAMIKSDYLKLIEYLDTNLDYTNDEAFLIYSKDKKYHHCCNYLASNKTCFGRIKGIVGAFPIKLDIRPLNVIENTTEAIKKNKILRDKANYILYGKQYFPDKWKIEELKNKKRQIEFLEWYNKEYGLSDSGTKLAHPYFEYSTNDTYEINQFIPTKRVKYENQYASIPRDYDNYLKKLYGDYMKLPIVNKRVPMVYEYFTPHNRNKLNDDIRIIMNPNSPKISRYVAMIKLLGISKLINILTEKYERN